MGVTRRSYRLVALAGIMCIFFSPIARAATLFQSIPDLNVQPAFDGLCSSCVGFNFRLFDVFSLGAASSVESISFNIRPPIASSNSISIWSVSGTAPTFFPETELFAQTIPSFNFESVVLNTFSGIEVSTITLNPVGLALSAGTYMFSVFEPFSITQPPDLKIPAYLGGSGLLYQSGDTHPDGYRHFVDHSLGFHINGQELVGETPLPAALPLFASILAAGGFMGWWRKRVARRAG